MKKIFIILFILSCSSTKYKAPSVVLKTPISAKLDHNVLVKPAYFKKDSKLLIFYQNYDLLEFADTVGLSQGIEFGIDKFIEKLKSSNYFKHIEIQSISHISINSINSLLELARRHQADYFILLSSSYNYYRYAYTLGYFIAWVPIFNYFTPIYSSTASIFIQADFFTANGYALFSSLINYEQKENLAIAFNKEHLIKLAKEANYNAYIKAYENFILKLSEEKQ